MSREFADLAEFAAAAGSLIGPSDWLVVTQERLDLFADATGDRQWIHLDPVRAATGPHGGTVAQNFLTLALLGALSEQIYVVHGVTLGINYGANSLRFPSPVRTGSRIRATARVRAVREIAIGSQFTIEFVLECEGAEEPACIAEVLFVMA